MNDKNLKLWNDANILSDKLNKFYREYETTLQLTDRLTLSDAIKVLESIRDGVKDES